MSSGQSLRLHFEPLPQMEYPMKFHPSYLVFAAHEVAV